jgi:hypothetical protein
MRTIQILDSIDKLSIKELNEAIELERAKIDTISSQLATARQNKRENGIKADEDWYKKACSVLKLNKFKLMLMNRRRTILSSSVIVPCSLPDKFMIVAKRLLKEDTYERLLEEAKEI